MQRERALTRGATYHSCWVEVLATLSVVGACVRVRVMVRIVVSVRRLHPSRLSLCGRFLRRDEVLRGHGRVGPSRRWTRRVASRGPLQLATADRDAEARRTDGRRRRRRRRRDDGTRRGGSKRCQGRRCSSEARRHHARTRAEGYLRASEGKPNDDSTSEETNLVATVRPASESKRGGDGEVVTSQ